MGFFGIPRGWVMLRCLEHFCVALPSFYSIRLLTIHVCFFFILAVFRLVLDRDIWLWSVFFWMCLGRLTLVASVVLFLSMDGFDLDTDGLALPGVLIFL